MGARALILLDQRWFPGLWGPDMKAKSQKP